MNNDIVRWERYSPVGIGLEEMFKRLDVLADSEASSTYPPYNIVKLDDYKQQLQIALAGFTREDIEVAVEKKVLNVKVQKPHEDVGEYVHKGIARRTFARNWQLSEDTEVGDVTYIDGLLCIDLLKVVPEEHKRRVLTIT